MIEHNRCHADKNNCFCDIAAEKLGTSAAISQKAAYFCDISADYNQCSAGISRLQGDFCDIPAGNCLASAAISHLGRELCDIPAELYRLSAGISQKRLVSRVVPHNCCLRHTRHRGDVPIGHHSHALCATQTNRYTEDTEGNLPQIERTRNCPVRFEATIISSLCSRVHPSASVCANPELATTTPPPSIPR